jgi:glycosyltransferase involved in cell wall biosynthesis
MMGTSSPPLVSVVICTRNRSRDLINALTSVVHQRPDSPSFEVVVVDNGSSDATREVVATFEARCRLVYVYEPTPGLCHARNVGWRTARGRYAAYLDDDATACASWVSAIVEAFAMCPDAGAVGGRVAPVWLADRPSWLSDHVARALTIVDWSPVPKVLADVGEEWLVGANLAVPVDLLRVIGGFRPELDRSGTGMLSSGDIFLLRQIVRAGRVCFYYPEMAVDHAVPAIRLTKRWFLRRYYWQGVSDAVMELLEGRDLTRRHSAAIRALADLVRSRRRLAALLPTRDPDKFAETCWTLIAIGRVMGLLGAAELDVADATRPRS